MSPLLETLHLKRFKLRDRKLTPERLQQNIEYLQAVQWFRKILPLLALVLALVIILWPKIDDYLNAVPSKLPRVEQSLQMKNKLVSLKMSSLDEHGRPYTIKAKAATQIDKETADFEKPDSIHVLEDGREVKITADKGRFSESSHLLEYHDNVALKDNEGYELRTQNAHLDLKTKMAEGDVPVAGEGPAGRIEAQGFKVDQEGNRIHFTGESHLMIKTTPETKGKK